METARQVTTEEYQPQHIAAPQPGMLVEVESVTCHVDDGSESIRRHVGVTRRVEGDNVLIVPEEGPWVVACIGDHIDSKGNTVTTRLFEAEQE